MFLEYTKQETTQEISPISKGQVPSEKAMKFEEILQLKFDAAQ